jgi:anti-sigma factor RsiW
MMEACTLFDKYRDGELDVSRRIAFESHMTECGACRARMSLLNNLVYVLKQEELHPVDLAERIAKKAFQQTPSWDVLVVSWFRPRFAVAALGLTLILASFLWLVPMNQPVAAYTEYEKLLNAAEGSDLASKLLVQNDSELVLQLEQEGSSE